MKLRGKLLLASLCLLVLPWAGWQFLSLMGDVLREGEERALLASAEVVARGLAQRPGQLPAPGAAVFARPLARAPRLDGDAGDWGEAAAVQRFADGPGLSLGLHDDTVYLFLDVPDGTHQRGAAHWPNADRRDHVGLILHGRQGVIELRLANAESGALTVTDADGGPPPLRLAGHWREAAAGYAVELALPQGYALRALAIRVVDADGEGGFRVYDSRDDAQGRPWQVHQRSPALSGSLAQLLPDGSAARLFNLDGRLLAQAGGLAGLRIDGAVPVWRRWLYHRLLFRHAPRPPDEDERSALPPAGGEGEPPVAGWRSDPASQRAIVSIRVPLEVADTPRAVLELERESDALLRLTDRAFSGLFAVTALAVLAAVLALFVFAGRLSGRIRRLRDAAENALDRQGRVQVLPMVKARDEIGDLSRSFARLLDEVRIYTSYLKGLAGKLSHELSTPIAVVRTSLENLDAEPVSDEARVYLERARSGVERLAGLVRAMSEASRIEQAIAAAEIERFDLRALVADCAEGYRPLLAPRALDLQVPPDPLPFDGAPDLIVQALDKLIDNARSFCPAQGWVRIGLEADASGAVLRVANSGPPLPEAMAGKLFDSMVSVRERRGGEVHLGFGLHVVRLVADLHNGQASAANRVDGGGVEFTMALAGSPTAGNERSPRP